MRKVIHVEKQSKKAQKAYYAKKRNTWDVNLAPLNRGLVGASLSMEAKRQPYI